MWQTYAMLSAVFAAPVLRGTPAPVLQARLGFARGAEAQKNAPDCGSVLRLPNFRAA